MLPLALTDAGWAVTGAIGGAFVGAVAGGAIDGFFAWRRERKLAKAGARLVASEIAAYDSQLESCEDEGVWWRWYGKEITSWPEYRDVLATKLGQEEFEAVSQAVMGLESLRGDMPNVPGFRDDPDRAHVPIKFEFVRPMRADTAKAYNALAGLAGHKREGVVIERPDKPGAP